MDPTQPPPSLQHNVVPAAPYSTRPPSPPYIHVPPVRPYGNFTIPTTDPDGHDNDVNTNNSNPANVIVHPPPAPGTAPESAGVAMTIYPSPTAAAYALASSFSSSSSSSSSVLSSRSQSGQSLTPTPTPTPTLTPADVRAITRGAAPQRARDRATRWVYEARRAAQPVLDFVWLGPASAARDRAFVERERFTLVLAVRDARFAAANAAAPAAARFASGGGVGGVAGGDVLERVLRRAVEGLSWEVEVGVVDVGEAGDMVAAFDRAAAAINAHLLAVCRARREPAGKVLVCCETGNHRSAAVVAAYLMAMYALDTVQAAQFLLLQRFCVDLDDDVKHMLQSYGDILRARRDVAAAAAAAAAKEEEEEEEEAKGAADQRNDADGRAAAIGITTAIATGTGTGTALQSKRRIDQTQSPPREGEEESDVVMTDEMDEDRYWNRHFAPFVERSA